MDIIEQLRQEHDELAYMMDELLNLEDGARTSHDYLSSFQRIIAHEGAKAEALYELILLNPKLSEAAEKGQQEQRGIREAIERLNAIRPDNERWNDDLTEMRRRLVEHFRTEEESIFPRLGEILAPPDLAEVEETYLLAYRSMERPPSRVLDRM